MTAPNERRQTIRTAASRLETVKPALANLLPNVSELRDAAQRVAMIKDILARLHDEECAAQFVNGESNAERREATKFLGLAVSELEAFGKESEDLINITNSLGDRLLEALYNAARAT